MKNLILGLVIGPTAASVYMGLVHYLYGRSDLGLKAFIYAPVGAFNYLIYMIPISFLVGLPAYYLLQKLRLLTGLTVSCYGVLIGSTVAWLLTNRSIFSFLFFSSGGLIAATVAWFVLKYKSNKSFESRAL